MSSHEDQHDEVLGGRPAPYAMVPHWIILHPELDPQAKAVYDVLLMHANRLRGDGIVWPTRKNIAKILGWSREQSPDKYIAQLEAAGAIDTELYTQHDGSIRKRYYVHQTPPPGYQGPKDLTEWRDRRRQEEAEAPSRPPGRPRKAASPAAEPAAEGSAAPQKPARKPPAKKAAATPSAKAAPEKSETEALLEQRANKGARLWWEERAPAHVAAKEMTRLTGTQQQKSRKFLALRGMIRGALAADYESRQILNALDELKVWLPSVQQFDAALGRQDGVRSRTSGTRQPKFTNAQWSSPNEEAEAPDLGVFGLEDDDAA
ncbi:hypothetical protein [Streptomyces sp. NPDC097619]|uniref:hypothetical protein n=1 Tax=Streptomyces sp. NPDC097619 TaxID=3157228 RepID=UPI003325C3C4